MPITRSQANFAAHQRSLTVLLDNDLLAMILFRAPFYAHDILKAVCKTFKNILETDFHQRRLVAGFTEPVVLAFGGNDAFDGERYHKHLLALIDHQWVYRNSLCAWGNDLYSSMLHDHLIVVGGGEIGRGRRCKDDVVKGLVVHAYNILDDSWWQLKAKNPPAHNRRQAACALADDETIIIAGGEIENWDAADDDETFDFNPTASALALTIEPETLAATWSELPPMEHAVVALEAFALPGRFYVLGTTKELGRYQEPSSLVMQALDLKSKVWRTCAALPAGVTPDVGAVHSGRFFALSFCAGTSDDGKETLFSPVVHAFDPATDEWNLQNELPKSSDCNTWSQSGAFQWSRGIAMTSCAAGLLVLDRSGGQVALLKVVDGAITSVDTLSSECWSERISMFAQDHLLENLHIASFELSAECKPLLADWAERIDSLQKEEEEMWDGDEDEDEYCPEVDNLCEARLWLVNAGLPLAVARGARDALHR